MIGLIVDAIRITVMVIVGIMLLPLLIVFPFALG